MNNPGYNCKHGSAWQTWQTAGADWRRENPTATRDNSENAALSFAAISGYPTIGQNARYRAFMECAN